jgi:hypothetical protein
MVPLFASSLYVTEVIGSSKGAAAENHAAKQLSQSGVGVEKVRFASKQPKFGGYKMSRKLRKSFVGQPSANLFWLISREGVFQQPPIALTTWTVSDSGQMTGNSYLIGKGRVADDPLTVAFTALQQLVRQLHKIVRHDIE